MENDAIAMKLGEIAGKLGIVAEQQTMMMRDMRALNDGQTAVLQKIASLDTGQRNHHERLEKIEGNVHDQDVAHSARMDSVETRVRGVEQSSVRNSAIAGLLAGTGASLIAEALRQFLHIRGGG